MLPLNDYWAVVRQHYAAFEQTLPSSSTFSVVFLVFSLAKLAISGTDVFLHEMPGGQYTNLLFQSQQMGLSSQWPAVKKVSVLFFPTFCH